MGRNAAGRPRQRLGGVARAHDARVEHLTQVRGANVERTGPAEANIRPPPTWRTARRSDSHPPGTAVSSCWTSRCRRPMTLTAVGASKPSVRAIREPVTVTSSSLRSSCAVAAPEASTVANPARNPAPFNARRTETATSDRCPAAVIRVFNAIPLNLFCCQRKNRQVAKPTTNQPFAPRQHVRTAVRPQEHAIEQRPGCFVLSLDASACHVMRPRVAHAGFPYTAQTAAACRGCYRS